MNEQLDAKLTTITDQLSAVTRKQDNDRDPAHEDFYTWGWALTELLDRVDQIASVLDRQVEHYGDRRILRDDAGWDPQHRLDVAGDELERLREALAPAREAVRRYHSAIGHVGIEVDPDAEVGA